MLQYNVRDILADPRIVITVEETLDLPSISFGKEGECVGVSRGGSSDREDALQSLYDRCGGSPHT